MKKIKLSWSILSAWSSGDKDRAIKMLMGEEMEATFPMEEGIRIHDLIAEKKLLLLPFMSKDAIFEKVVPDREKCINYFRVEIFDWLDISMIADVLDMKSEMGRLLIDWKTGSRKSMEHNKLQLYVYAYALSMLPEPIVIDNAVIAKVGEDSSGAILLEDWSLYKITPEKLELAENYIESNASEIYASLGFDKQD